MQNLRRKYVVVISVMAAGTGIVELLVWLAIFGFGLGMALTVFALTVQNAVEQSKLGTATAVYQLFRQLGATIGLAVMGAIMNVRMGGRKLVGDELLQNPDLLGYALSGTFQFGAYAVAAALLFTCFLRDQLTIEEGMTGNDQGVIHYGTLAFCPKPLPMVFWSQKR